MPLTSHAQNLYVADLGPTVSFDPSYQGGAIYRFTPNGTRTVFATNLTRPVGLAFDPAGNLFVADLVRRTIYWAQHWQQRSDRQQSVDHTDYALSLEIIP